MATAQIEAPRSPRIDPKYNRSRKSRNNFEMMAWLFMRFSGVVLIVLIFGHLITNLLVGDGVAAIDFGFVAGKWANPLWQFWDLTMLWLKTILYIASIFTVILGTMVIFTFDPCIPGSTLAVCGA